MKFRFTDKSGKRHSWSRAQLDDTLLESEKWDRAAVRKRIDKLGVGKSITIAGETLTRVSNPKVSYAAVPVDADEDDVDETTYVTRVGRARDDTQRSSTRGRRVDEGIRIVAGELPDDARINVDRARSFPTKRAAVAYGEQTSPELVVLARRLARGES